MADKTGIWLIGARGAVATTVSLGLAALQQRLIATTGLVTESPLFSGLDLVDWNQLVIGGHELGSGCLVQTAESLSATDRVFSPQLTAACRDHLAAIDARIRPGITFRSGAGIAGGEQACGQIDSPRLGIEQVKQDLRTFVQEHDLDQVVVVLLASTEPETPLDSLPEHWGELALTLETNAACALRASSLYAIAAFELGLPFVNFTPSLGASCPALEDLANQQSTCHAGRDGKTGETLLKTVLAPMFAARNLEVMSWVGHNILGNADGQVLDHPDHKASKLESKDGALDQLLGYRPQSLVSIEYIRSLGDWKTAWDHVHFRGFMGAAMTLQFTWQGCDSALAAPLVLDLVRLTNHAAQRGETGALGYLASFFKSPAGSLSHDFFTQQTKLAEYIESITE